MDEDLGVLAVLEELGDVIGRRHNLRQLANEDLVQLLKLGVKFLGIQGGYLRHKCTFKETNQALGQNLPGSTTSSLTMHALGRALT